MADNTFDDLVNKAKDMAVAVGKKTGELVEISKLRVQSATVNGDIDKVYQRMGAVVYSCAKSGTDSAELVKQCIREIDELNVKLDEIHAKLADLRRRDEKPGSYYETQGGREDYSQQHEDWPEEGRTGKPGVSSVEDEPSVDEFSE